MIAIVFVPFSLFPGCQIFNLRVDCLLNYTVINRDRNVNGELKIQHRELTSTEFFTTVQCAQTIASTFKYLHLWHSSCRHRGRYSTSVLALPN